MTPTRINADIGLAIAGMKRLAARSTWWHTLPHKSELAVSEGAGREVAVLRQGTEVARLVPADGRRRRLPSLATFRRTISVRGEPLSTTVVRSRREARY